MKKIPTLFERDHTGNRQVLPIVTAGCEWVQDGQGVPYVKIDGTSCMVKSGILYRRFELKRGKTPPPEFIPAQEPDPVTGDVPGWVYCAPNDPNSKHHLKALANWHKRYDGLDPFDGTYELVGPKVQGNPYGLTEHELIPHDHPSIRLADVLWYNLTECVAQFRSMSMMLFQPDYRFIKFADVAKASVYVPTGFDALREYLTNLNAEGIVWHHPDGRMAKIKRRDFGLEWPVEDVTNE